MNIKIRLSYFRKLLISYSAIVLVPTLILSSVYFYYYSNQLKDNLESESKTELQTYSSLAATMTSEIDRLSLQFSFIPQLSDVLKDTSYSAYNYRVLQNTMQTSISSNHLVESVYLYTKINGKVLTTGEGIYTLDDFYDRDLVVNADTDENILQWHQVRALKRQSDTNPAPIITFSRRIPASSKDSLGILIFNIRMDMFFETLQIFREEGQPVYVLDSTGNTIYSPGADVPVLEERAGELKQMKPDRLVSLKLGSVSYFASVKHSQSLDWTYVRLIPKAEYSRLMSAKLSKAFGFILLLTVLFIGFAYIMTLVMYSPLKRIIAGVAERLKMTNPTGKESDWNWMENAVAQIMSENEQIKTSIEQNRSIMKERWVHDIFHQHVTSEESLSERRLHEIGIHFPYRYFLDLAVYMDLRKHSRNEHHRIRLLLFSLIESAFQKQYGVAGTILGNETLGFIINTDREAIDEEFRGLLRQTVDPVTELAHRELNVNLQLLFGRVHQSLSDFIEKGGSRNGLRYKAFVHPVDVVFAQDLRDSGKGAGYPSQYVNLLATYIRDGDKNKAAEFIHQLFQNYVYQSNASQEHLLETLLMMLSAIAHELRKEEDDWNETPAPRSLMHIYEAHSKQELEVFFREYIEHLAEGRAVEAEERQNVHVIRAIEYMKEHYNNNRSISDIAVHLGISSSYLSRVFKAELGKSPQEYLTEYRIERGKAYLEDPQLSLQEISTFIGYSDAHSFIRYFKKFTGLTPGEYRNRFVNKM